LKVTAVPNSANLNRHTAKKHQINNSLRLQREAETMEI
jgi:hypothetical protein